MLESPRSQRRATVQPGESGRGYLGLVITLLVLGALAFVAIQAVPVYVHNFELEESAHELAVQVAANRIPLDTVTSAITNRAADLDLPVAFQDVSAVIDGGMVRIRIRYTVPVDLKVYTWPMHLSVSTSAPRLVY
ncbi:MAG TPA: hypothetical protein VKV79_02770 [Terriglobia bacterium]|nr:hypothetical protein [Terriglobia bacterium]